MARRRSPRARAAPPIDRPQPHTFPWRTLLVVAGLVAFSIGLNAPFVFDDRENIVRNSYIRQLWPVEAPPQSAVAGRPVVALSLAISYASGGLDPAVFRAWNLAVHITAALLLFAILRRTLTITPAVDALAFTAALVWLIHPLQSEVIGYVLQRTESMMAVCYLTTLYAAARVMSSGSRKWAIITIGAGAAGMACKESMVTAPVMVLLYDAVFHAGSIRGALHKRRWLYAGLASTWIVLWLLIASGPRWRSAGFESGVSPWAYLLNQPAMILTYLRLAIWPDPLILDYGVTHPIALRDALWPSIVVVALVVTSALAWLKSRPLGYALTWFWITLAPTSSFVPIATEVGAERRMYLPLMAVIVVGVVAAYRCSERLTADLPHRSRRWFIGAEAGMIVVVCLTAIALNHRRLREYGSEIGLWETVLSRRPHDRAHYNLGIALAEAGRHEEAIPHYRQSVGDQPRAHYALGLELERRGEYEDARRQYEAFLRRNPDDPQAPQGHARLGIVLAHLGQNDAAIGELEQAIRMRPALTDALGTLADVMLNQQRFDEAEYAYRRYVAAAPADAHAHRSLGLALVHQNRLADAIPPLQRAVQLDPADGAARLYLGNALMAIRRPDAAEEHYREGWRLVPESPTLPKALAGALVLLNRPSEAIAVLEEARRRHPADEEIEAAYADLRRGVPRSSP